MHECTFGRLVALLQISIEDNTEQDGFIKVKSDSDYVYALQRYMRITMRCTCVSNTVHGEGCGWSIRSIRIRYPEVCSDIAQNDGIAVTSGKDYNCQQTCMCFDVSRKLLH